MTRAYLCCIDPGCGKTLPLDSPQLACEGCGGLLDVAYEFAPADPAELRRLWRERPRSEQTCDPRGGWGFRGPLSFFAPPAAAVAGGGGGGGGAGGAGGGGRGGARGRRG